MNWLVRLTRTSTDADPVQTDVWRLLDKTTLGRAPDNDIVLSDPTISRHHAAIARRGDRHVVWDVASTSGSYVNAARLVGEHVLVAGDQLRLGALDFEYAAESDLVRRALGVLHEATGLESEHMGYAAKKSALFATVTLLDGLLSSEQWQHELAHPNAVTRLYALMMLARRAVPIEHAKFADLLRDHTRVSAIDGCTITSDTVARRAATILLGMAEPDRTLLEIAVDQPDVTLLRSRLQAKLDQLGRRG